MTDEVTFILMFDEFDEDNYYRAYSVKLYFIRTIAFIYSPSHKFFRLSFNKNVTFQIAGNKTNWTKRIPLFKLFYFSFQNVCCWKQDQTILWTYSRGLSSKRRCGHNVKVFQLFQWWLYISASISVLRTPNFGQNLYSPCFYTFLQGFNAKMMKMRQYQNGGVAPQKTGKFMFQFP